MADQSQYFWRVTSLHNKRRGRGGEGRYFSIENARSRTAQWVLQPSQKHKDTRKERPLPLLLLLIPGAPRRSSLWIWTPWSVRNELIGPWVMRETGAILIFCIILDEREREREREIWLPSDATGTVLLYGFPVSPVFCRPTWGGPRA